MGDALPFGMTPEQWDRYLACSACDQLLEVGTDTVFLIEGDDCLCLECAQQRGAIYDRPRDAWVRPPDLSGLL